MNRRRRSAEGARAFLVSQWFPPEPAGQALRAARLLEASGYTTAVITGIPNYPSGTVPAGYRATQVRTERIAGFPVHRTPLYPSHDGNAARRILNYVSWAVSASVLASWRLRCADVVLVYSSPATAALPAMVARKLFGTPYVLLIQDVWPDSVFSSGFLKGGVAGLAKRLIEFFVDLAYRWSSQIVVISPGMVGLLESRGVEAGKLSLIYNAVDSVQMHARATHLSRAILGIPDSALTLMYAGNHGAAQALDLLIKAVAECDDLAREVHLVMVGDGMAKPALKELAESVAPARVHFIEPQPREAMGSLMQIADVQVVSLADEPLFSVTMPSKLQSALAAGAPVLAIARGDVGDVIASADCGRVATPGEVGSVLGAIEDLMTSTSDELSAMGRAALAYYNDHMTDTVAIERMRAVLTRARR